MQKMKHNKFYIKKNNFIYSFRSYMKKLTKIVVFGEKRLQIYCETV